MNSMVADPPAAGGSGYSRAHAEIYDVIHSARGHDWAAEADDVAELVRSRAPHARSVLDVACGTGQHLVRLAEHFPEVAGLELSAPMRAIAGAKLPGRAVYDGDMRDIRIDRTFDAVLCMCYSLGYMESLGDLRQAVASLARCLAPGGVVIAEPWWFPETFLDGFVAAGLSHEPGRAVSRISHTVRRGRSTLMTVHYTVADGDGIRHFEELENYTLFDRDEYLDAFRRAGLRADYTPGAPNNRGLFVAVRD